MPIVSRAILVTLTGMTGFHFSTHMIAMAAYMGTMHRQTLHLTMFGMFLHSAVPGRSRSRIAVNRQRGTQQEHKHPTQKCHHRPKKIRLQKPGTKNIFDATAVIKPCRMRKRHQSGLRSLGRTLISVFDASTVRIITSRMSINNADKTPLA